MKLVKAIVSFCVAIGLSTALAFGQTAPNTENGFKSFGSYDGSSIDTVNLENGNLMLHIPLFSYPQRGQVGLGYSLQLSSKQWQVGQYSGTNNALLYRWMLAAQAGLTMTSTYDVTVRRGRTITTDINGNVSEADFDYAVHTGDGAVHWLSDFLANGNMVTVDGSNFQFTLIRGTKFDHSDDSGVLKDSKGNTYNYPIISNDYSKLAPASGNSYNLVSHVAYANELMPDGNNTVQTFNDFGIPSTWVDANGNTMKLGFFFDPVTATVGINSVVDGNGNTINFSSGTGAGAAPTTNCPTLSPASSAYLFSFPGPNGNVSPLTICYTSVTLAPTFSQPNVQAPKNDTFFKSYPLGGNPPPVGGLIMPDGAKWAFSYDAYGNITATDLPTGGSITYGWTEISIPNCGNGDTTQVSRAVATRTINDLVNPPRTWQYTWGTMQPDGSITNYVLDPNGNETAHVFKSPVSTVPCALYETETRIYQGTHQTGTLLKTVDTHYVGFADYTQDTAFASRVVADTVTTTLPGNKISQIARQYDGYPNPTTFAKLTDEKVYDYANTLVRETVTTYEWQLNSAYLNAGLIDLPASVVIKDGSGCALAETDYTYDEPGYLTTYTSTLPAGVHGSAPGGTVRGNLTTVTKWAAPTSSCNPKSGIAVIGHTNWYDTGESYQQIDPLGHTTTHSYDPVYAGAFATQTCSPSTNGGTVSHCVSGTYDFVTGLLDSLTNENATTQASGSTQGDSAHTSNYSYDTSWRLIQAQAPPDPTNGNARATTTLTPSAPNAFPLSVQHQRSVTTALTDTSTAYFDGVARVNETSHSLSNGMANVTTTYDGLGHATSVTNPYFTTSDPTYGATSKQYDGLGRVTQITKQDGSINSVKYNAVTSIAMNADCAITKDEAGNQRGTCTDALGRLVEVDEPNPGTTPSVSNYAIMQTDGNFVLYNPTNTALWSTGTSGVSNAQTVMMQDDGNLVLYIFKWFTGVYAAPSPGPFPPATCSIGTYLVAGETLPSGKCIASPHGQYFLYMSPDGNFYIYDYSQGHASWGANVTVGHPGAYALLQMDGNFVVNDVNGVTLWSSGTGGSNAERLDMEDDGRMVIWKSAWNSGTSTGQFNTTQLAHPSCDVGTAIGSTGAIGAGQCVVSSNGHYELLLQTDGNMVLYDRSTTPLSVLWMTNTPISPADPGIALRTLYTYDALGNLTCVEQHGGVTGTGCSSSAANDATSPWRVRRFTYDSLGRLLTAKNPESGTISYTYDNDGNLLQKTSPAPNQTNPAVTQTISYCYDELHRVTGRAYGALSCPLASPVVSYTYDSGTNAKGKLTSMTDQAGTAAYNYDVLERLSSETRVISGVKKSMSYGYNLDGSMNTMTYPSGAIVAYTPDSAGRLVSAVDNAHGINYVTGATNGPDGSLTGFVNGSSGAAAITNTFTYNKRLQPVTMSAATSSQTVFSIGYDFHAGNGTAGSGSDNGNVFALNNYKDANRNQTFSYDALNRLLSAQNAGTNCSLKTANGKTEYWGNTYTYDAWGNLLQKNVTKCSAENAILTMNGNNQALYYSYDAAGNMINDGIFAYTFDPENRLTGVSGYIYTYDADGNRVKKASGSAGMLYWYMTPGVVAETDLSGNNAHEYIFFNGKRVARRDSNGLVYYYFSDLLKTASVVTDSSGIIKGESDYYPWGGELQLVANDSNHYKFTGKERDGESGLDYFGARYYSGALSRFMTPDWASKPTTVPYAEFGNPQSLNLYSFVKNNPMSLADIDGHQTSSDQPCSDKGSGCTSSTTIDVNDGQAWITTRIEHHWEDDDGNAHTSISYTSVQVQNIEESGGGKYGILSVYQNTTTFSGTDWQNGKIESVHARSWTGKELDDNNHLGLQVAVKMVGLQNISKGAEAAGRSVLSRMPEEAAKDYHEHPHYYHAVVAGAVALPVTATAATATGIALGIYATIEGIRDHVNDPRPLP